MLVTAFYDSPIGRMVMSGDGAYITRLSFLHDKAEEPARGRKNAAMDAGFRWLDEYYAGGIPKSCPPILLKGTDFQRMVWALLMDVPYGQTTTYGALARLIEAKTHRRMSAQAVGGAVGRNPIAVIVPCHRVIGADGSLVGYADGLDKKAALLKIEGII